MALTENINLQLPEFIKKALEKSLEAEYEELIKEMVKKFEADIMRRRDTVIAGVMLNVSRNMSFTEIGNILRVEIIKEEKTQKSS